jgi:hypothetical protein
MEGPILKDLLPVPLAHCFVGFFSVYVSTLKIDATSSCETSVNFQRNK